jgi:hypothetical protein
MPYLWDYVASAAVLCYYDILPEQWFPLPLLLILAVIPVGERHPLHPLRKIKRENLSDEAGIQLWVDVVTRLVQAVIIVWFMILGGVLAYLSLEQPTKPIVAAVVAIYLCRIFFCDAIGPQPWIREEVYSEEEWLGLVKRAREE